MKASSNLLQENIKPLKDDALLVFDELRMNLRNRSLEKAGSAIRLAPKVFETLALLVHSSPNAVSREELRAALWPGVTVEDSVLGQYVYLLRKALGNRPTGESYIETLPKLGYRFTGEVRKKQVQSQAVAAGMAPNPARSRRILLAWCVVALVSGIAGFMMLRFRHRVPNPESVRLTRLATAIWKQRQDSPDDERYFREALRIDPDYAEAHAGLAATLALRAYPAREAKAEVAKALALDPRSSFAYAVRGFISMMHDWDFAGAATDLRHATELDPANAMADQWYALYHALQGRSSESLHILDNALSREPASANLLTSKCDLLYFEGRYREAEASCVAALQVNPAFRFAKDRLLYVSGMAGDWETAISVGGRTVEIKARYRDAIQQDGGSGFWRVLKEDLIEKHGHPFYIARAEAQLNDRAAALNEIESIVSGHGFLSVFLGVDPALRNLHSEARFQAACRTVGIPCK